MPRFQPTAEHRADKPSDEEVVLALHQYRSDLRYPPAPDSIERRIAMIEKLLARLEGK